jgi:hypothetical protein
MSHWGYEIEGFRYRFYGYRWLSRLNQKSCRLAHLGTAFSLLLN